MSETYDGGGGPAGHVIWSPCAATYDGQGGSISHVTWSMDAAIVCLGHTPWH